MFYRIISSFGFVAVSSLQLLGAAPLSYSTQVFVEPKEEEGALFQVVISEHDAEKNTSKVIMSPKFVTNKEDSSVLQVGTDEDEVKVVGFLSHDEENIAICNVEVSKKGQPVYTSQTKLPIK